MIKLIVQFVTGLMVAIRDTLFGPESHSAERYRMMRDQHER